MEIKILCIVAALTLNISALCQIGIGPSEYTIKPRKLNASELYKLYSSKTIFVCGENDDAELLQEELNEVWDYTELEVVKYTQLKYLKDKNYSYFSIRGLSNNSNIEFYNGTFENSVVSSVEHYFLSLWMYSDRAQSKSTINPKKDVIRFAHVLLYMDYKDYEPAPKSLSNLELYYKYYKFKNWNINFIKTYVGIINSYLKKQEKRSIFKNSVNSGLAELKNGILYIPEFSFENPYFPKSDTSSQDSIEGGTSQEELLEAYAYKYKVIDTKKFNELLSSSTKPVIFLVNVHSSSDKFIAVYKSDPPEILYSRYKPISLGFSGISKSDFKALNKKIKSSK